MRVREADHLHPLWGGIEMHKRICRRLAWTLVVAAVWGVAYAAWAQESYVPQPSDNAGDSSASDINRAPPTAPVGRNPAVVLVG